VHDAGVVEPNKTVKGRVFTGGAAEGEGKDECNRLELDVPKRSVKQSQSVVGIIATKRIVTSPSSMSCVPLGVGTQTNRNNKRASQRMFRQIDRHLSWKARLTFMSHHLPHQQHHPRLLARINQLITTSCMMMNGTNPSPAYLRSKE
jgi:hypothetical protein